MVQIPQRFNQSCQLWHYVRTALQQKRSTDGNQEAQAVVNQYSGTYPNPQAVHNLFSQPETTLRMLPSGRG